jgi:hypothetical protein
LPLFRPPGPELEGNTGAEYGTLRACGCLAGWNPPLLLWLGWFGAATCGARVGCAATGATDECCTGV